MPVTPTANDREYCTQVLLDSGSNFLAGFILLPAERRAALTALYAFCRQVDDIADNSSDPQVAGTKLNWWLTEVAQIFANDDQPIQHPISRCLHHDVRRFNMDHQLFVGILSGVQSDLSWSVCTGRQQLMDYCYRVSCCVGLLSIAIFGYQRPEVEQYAIKLGYAMQLTNIIRDIRCDARQQRVYLPADELDQFGVTAEVLLQSTTTPEGLRRYLRQLGTEVRQMYRDAFSILDIKEYRAQLPGLVMGLSYYKLLKEIERDDYSVIDYMCALPPHRKLLTVLECLLRSWLKIPFKRL